METNTAKTFALSEHISRHPYQSLLIASGVGYILAGGLFTRLTYSVLQAGARVAALPIVQREILAVAAMALGMQAASSAEDAPVHTTSDNTN